MFEEHIGWGTVPEWIMAFASLGALIAAVRAGRAALSQVGLTRSQAAHAEAQARQASEQTALMRRGQEREQAALIAAWLDYDSERGLRAMALNASPAPVYDVTLNFHSNLDHERQYLPILLPNSGPMIVEGLSAAIAEAVRQHPSILKTWKAQSEGESLPDVVDEAQDPVGLTINFHDGAGRCWTRELNGELRGPDEQAQLSRY